MAGRLPWARAGDPTYTRGSRGRPGSRRPRNERTAHHGHGRASTGGHPGRVPRGGRGALVGAAGCREALCVTPSAGTPRWYRQLPGMDHPSMPVPTYTLVLARATRPAGVPGGASGCWRLAQGVLWFLQGVLWLAQGVLAARSRGRPDLHASCSRGRPGPRGCQGVPVGAVAGPGGAVVPPGGAVARSRGRPGLSRSRGRPGPRTVMIPDCDSDGDTRTWARSRPRSRGRPGLSDLDLDRSRSRGRPGPPRAGNAREGRRSPSLISLPRSPRPAAAPRPSLEKSRRRGLTLSRS